MSPRSRLWWRKTERIARIPPGDPIASGALDIDTSLPWTQRVVGYRSTDPARDGAVMFPCPNNADRVIIVGGWGAVSPPGFPGGVITTNAVYYTDDIGTGNDVVWTQLLAHDETPPTSGAGARFRRVHTPVCFRHGAYQYLICGDYDIPHSEVWRTRDGETWEQIAASSAFGTRSLAFGISYLGKMYIGGGQTNPLDELTGLSDWWVSVDDGVTFTAEAAPPWSARSCGGKGLVIFGGLLYLVGGYLNGGTTYYDGVWSYNGTAWTQVLADGHGQWQWGGRGFYNIESLGGRMFLFNGTALVAGHTTSIEVSDDNGVTWTPFEAQLGQTKWGEMYAGSHADGMCVFKDRIVRHSGSAFDRETWEVGQFAEPSAAPVVSTCVPNTAAMAGGSVHVVTATGVVKSLRLGNDLYVDFVDNLDGTYTFTAPDLTGLNPVHYGAGAKYITLTGPGGDSSTSGANIITYSAGGSPAATPTEDWRDYAGAPWVGSVAATSLDQATGANQPVVGANFGTHPSADFDGTSDFFQSATTFAPLINATTASVTVVFEADAFVADGAGPEDGTPLLGGAGGSPYLPALSTSGVKSGYYDGVFGPVATPFAAVTVSTKTCAQVTFDSAGTYRIRVNGGAWQTAGAFAGNLTDSLTSLLRVGKNYDDTKFFNGRIAWIRTYDRTLSDADADLDYAYAQSEFGVT